MVVDDEPMIRRLVTWILERRGYSVIVAIDGQDGLDHFERHEDIDLVLSDIVMPRLDGVSMVEQLRLRRPDIPVLFMSGYTGPERSALKDEDLHRLLDKPFTAEQLVERIEQILTR
ncbi:MAG: response regulator [Myxococcota bacterium]